MANFQPSRKQRHGDALLHQVDHSVRRSSVSSICAGIQHSGGARMVAPKLLIPSTEIQGGHHVHISHQAFNEPGRRPCRLREKKSAPL